MQDWHTPVLPENEQSRRGHRLDRFSLFLFLVLQSSVHPFELHDKRGSMTHVDSEFVQIHADFPANEGIKRSCKQLAVLMFILLFLSFLSYFSLFFVCLHTLLPCYYRIMKGILLTSLLFLVSVWITGSAGVSISEVRRRSDGSEEYTMSFQTPNISIFNVSNRRSCVLSETFNTPSTPQENLYLCVAAPIPDAWRDSYIGRYLIPRAPLLRRFQCLTPRDCSQNRPKS